MARVAVILSTYNTPELGNAQAEHLRLHSPGQDVVLVDNGSAHPLVAELADVSLNKNVRLLHSWLLGLAYADGLAACGGYRHSAYWFLTTSLRFVDGQQDPVAALLAELEGHEEAVYVSPQYVGDCHWPHDQLRTPGQTLHLGGAGMYLADWFNQERFDPRLLDAWGTDFDTSIRAIREGKTGWVSEAVQMEIHENAGYKAGVHGATVQGYHERAGATMEAVLSEKYPREWPLVKEKDYEAVHRLHH